LGCEYYELTIARFIKGLSPNIAHKEELQPYLSFNDVSHIDIKIEKQLKGRKPFLTPSTYDHEAPPMFSPPITKLTLSLHISRPLTRVKGMSVALLKARRKEVCPMPWLWIVLSELSQLRNTLY